MIAHPSEIGSIIRSQRGEGSLDALHETRLQRSSDPRSDSEIAETEARAKAGVSIEGPQYRQVSATPSVTSSPPSSVSGLDLNGSKQCFLQGHRFTVSERDYQQIIKILMRNLSRSLREEAKRVAEMLTKGVPVNPVWHTKIQDVREVPGDREDGQEVLAGEIAPEELYSLRQAGAIP